MFFRQTEVSNLTVPVVPELGLNNMWSEAVKHPDFLKYLPDDWSQKNIKHVDRSFFYGILGTLMPDYLVARVEDVMDKRLEARQVPKPQQQINEIPENLLAELVAHKYESSKLSKPPKHLIPL